MRQLIAPGYQICQADDTLMSTPRIEGTGASTTSTAWTTLATFSVPEDYHPTQQSTFLLVVSFKTSTSGSNAWLRAVNGMEYPSDAGLMTVSLECRTAVIVVPCVGGDTIYLQGRNGSSGATMTLCYYNVYALDVHAKTDESPGGISWE